MGRPKKTMIIESSIAKELQGVTTVDYRKREFVLDIAKESYLAALKYGTQISEKGIESFVKNAALLYDLANNINDKSH